MHTALRLFKNTYICLLFFAFSNAPASPLAEKQIALLLPTQGQLSSSAEAIRNGFFAGFYEDTQDSADKAIKVYNTENQNISALYQYVQKQGANQIVGPLLKEQVNLINEQPISLPTLALNLTTEGSKQTLLYQFGLSPQDEAAQTAVKAFDSGLKHALIIAPNTAWGKSVEQSFTSQWQAQGGTVLDVFHYDDNKPYENGIRLLLQVDEKSQSRRRDADVVFMLANPKDARQFMPLLKFYFAAKLPVYATSLVYTGIPNAARDSDLNGITFCDVPLILENSAQMEEQRKQLNLVIPKAQAQLIRLYAFGYDAYQLSSRFGQLENPRFNFQGLSGVLYTDPNRQILRKLSWAKFENGVPKLLDHAA